MEKVETGTWSSQWQGSVEGWKAGEWSICIRMIRAASLGHCHFDKYVTTSLSVPLPASSLLTFYVPQYRPLFVPRSTSL